MPFFAQSAKKLSIPSLPTLSVPLSLAGTNIVFAFSCSGPDRFAATHELSALRSQVLTQHVRQAKSCWAGETTGSLRIKMEWKNLECNDDG